MRRTLLILGALGSLVVGAVAWWRRHPRFGARWVNRVVDPWLVRQGIVDKSAGEIALIEHVGRKSGAVRFSPVHPVPTEGGFRIIVPLGLESHWAQNVLTAGHCRLQVADVVYELDEPVLVSPSAIEGLPRLENRVMEWLGFRYLRLHRSAVAPGTLAGPSTQGTLAGPSTPAEPAVEKQFAPA